MKKFGVMALSCALVITAAGCGGNTQEQKEKDVVMELVGGDDSGQAASNDAQQKADDNNGSSDTAKTEAQEDNSAELYEEFKNGTAGAKYRGTGDMASNLNTASVLEVGKSYTMDEIAKALENADEYSGFKLSSDIQYSNIDCGQDGIPELLVVAPFTDSQAPDGEEYQLYMIIKAIDGELVICFDQDSWSRSGVTVNDDGTIDGDGSGGAAVHVSDYSFVDGNGDYKFYYGVEETLTLYGDYYAYTSPSNYITISTDGLDSDHLGVRDYYFDPDYDKRDHYYEYFVIDDNFNDVTTDADYDDSNELKKRFTEAGITTYTKSEMEKMRGDRASEIGYPRS